MPRDLPQEEGAVEIKFGGGVHSRASIDEIDPRECTEGINFELDLQDRNMKNRKPFDLIGTAGNAGEIRGFANLKKADGTVSLLIQAAETVYEWDGAATFTSRGTVAATMKMRGPLSHNSELDDKVIISDLNLADVVMTWDGTTLADAVFTKNDGSTAWTGTFKAKYVAIDHERVMYMNVDDNGSALPHLIVGSKTSDFTILSNDQSPSSALGEDDPYFLIQPDLKPINGGIHSFGRLVTSSNKGRLYELTGSSSKDFSFEALYDNSAASGDEAVAAVGNDIVYGRPGRIESLFATEKLGDTEADDLTTDIADVIADFDDWTIIYNSRLQRVYFFSAGSGQLWVLYKPLIGSGVSPWSKWTTNHSTGFAITAMMSMLDPADGLEYVFWGDANGNFYRMEGTGSGDGGTNQVTTERLSGLFKAPLDTEMYDFQGWFKYITGSAVTATISLEFGGMSLYAESVEMTIPGVPNINAYGGSKYYSNGVYYAAFTGKLSRQHMSIAGQGSEAQIRVTVNSNSDFEINEVGFRFQTSS